MKALDAKDIKIAKEFSDFVYASLHNVSLKTLDHIGAKAMYLISIAYERNGLTSLVRPMMFEAYKNSTLRQDHTGQATIMNIILRSYLSNNLYDQARSFITKTIFPQEAQNNQQARYLYYLGRIKAIQLEYSEAQVRLIQALRKGPEVGGIGFRV